MDAELTIVIPAKNELAMLPRMLESLCRQDYVGMCATRVLVADAGSTDGTVEAALGFRDRLKVEVVRGAAFGGKKCGRAAGDDEVCVVSRCGCGATGAYAGATGTVEDEAARAASGDDEYCLSRGWIFDDLLYAASNLMQRVGSLTKPFATGMFMLFDREAFWALGGFNERALFAEDYLLSKGVARIRFRIVGERADDQPEVSEAGAWADGLDVLQDDAA